MTTSPNEQQNPKTTEAEVTSGVMVHAKKKARPMHTLRRKPALRKTVATALFVFGTVALVMPLVPGWVLIGFGLYLLSIDSPEFQERIVRYRTKHRTLDKLLTHSYDKLQANEPPKDAT